MDKAYRYLIEEPIAALFTIVRAILGPIRHILTYTLLASAVITLASGRASSAFLVLGVAVLIQHGHSRHTPRHCFEYTAASPFGFLGVVMILLWLINPDSRLWGLNSTFTIVGLVIWDTELHRWQHRDDAGPEASHGHEGYPHYAKTIATLGLIIATAASVLVRISP